MLFLCKGVSVYRGASTNVVSYFGKQGYECEMHDNPADFALDALIDASRKPGELDKLDHAYRTSAMHTSVIALADVRLHDDSFEKQRRKQQGVAARSITSEIYYLAQRTLRNIIRSPELLLTQTMVSIIMALLVGLVFFDLKRTTVPGVQNRFGTLFFIIINQVFGALSSLEVLLKERVLFIHVSHFRIDVIT